MSRVLVTSALPYINGVKHLGNLVGSILPADVFARFQRLVGNEVLYICGTDEHGTPAEIAAAEAGLPVAEYCEKQYRIQRDIYGQFEIAFDYFGRTSSAANHQLTQQFATRLEDQGFITTQTSRQPYSPTDGRFLPDRYVVGTCPICGFERARGDQCDRCGNLLDPTMLINPRSTISGAEDVEFRDSKHLYLALDQLEPRVRQWVDTQMPHWSPVVSGIARKWLAEGLQPRPITRDLDWGVSVARPGFDGKVYYVWFDAPIGYISATVDWANATGASEAWLTWWRDATDVSYYQFMAKDNVPFHTIMWPAVLLGTGENWTMPDNIFGFEWLTYEGGKFSSSEKRGVFLDDALGILPAEVWRYALARMAPETADADFSFAELARHVNRDLVGLYGNLLNRVLSQMQRHWGQQVPPMAAADDLEDIDHRLLREAGEVVAEARESYAAGSMRRASDAIRKLWLLANGYLNDTEPWRTVKTDKNRAGTILRLASEILVTSAQISAPLMPGASKQVLDSFAVGHIHRSQWPDEVVGKVSDGVEFSIPPLLFQKVSDDDTAKWSELFAGSAA